MSADHIRLCPSCGTENAPQVMRCACGALLAGVDLVARPVTPPASSTPMRSGPASTVPLVASAATTATGATCPFEDCAQPNPPGSDTCLYCNRPLSVAPALQSLHRLPSALSSQYRLLRPLPVQGAEAELLLVQAIDGGAERVAKVYRHGIVPRADIQQRIASIDLQHRVDLIASGLSDGHAYELMEFCRHGSLRNYLNGPASPELLRAIVTEVGSAIACVHTAGLLHRDLKPENVLVRTEQPFDLVLTDFSISSVMDATQRFTSTARTLAYASPESLSGVLDTKTDYWALGMMLLEAARGAHPFAGLSEPVILHQLTTRSIELHAVADRNLRKLLRGLLLRDPKARWGQAEITRWLSNDPSLVEPAEHDVAAGFREPYHVGSETCHSMEQLAVALSRNWKLGLADFANGQLLKWFRDVQKDQNTVRLLLTLRHDAQMPVDRQLLTLILHLAPGIPPTWRGETVGLAQILQNANQALRGDADAIEWLDCLHRYRVLDTYAEAGNEECEDIVQKWTRSIDQFGAAWERGLGLIRANAPERVADEYVNFDNIAFGSDALARPPMGTMHGRMLAVAYDPKWGERLRQHLTPRLTELVVHCPWLARLADMAAVDAVSLLVVESLLPEARKAVDKQQKAIERRGVQEQRELAEMQLTLKVTLSALRNAAKDQGLGRLACETIRNALDTYFTVLTQVKREGRADAPWLELRKLALKPERAATKLQGLVHKLAEQQAANSGYFDVRVLPFLGIALLFGSEFIAGGSYVVAGAAIAVLVWRLAPTWSTKRQIREVADIL
jgi:tRNA A-37 threonylcarbamoyl transferase component Bud32